MEREVYEQAIERLQEWLDSLKGLSPPWEEYELLAAKPIQSVWDSEEIDIYVWYFDKTENQYIFMYGLDEPDREYADWTEETFLCALNWFCSYKGGKEDE